MTPASWEGWLLRGSLGTHRVTRLDLGAGGVGEKARRQPWKPPKAMRPQRERGDASKGDLGRRGGAVAGQAPHATGVGWSQGGENVSGHRAGPPGRVCAVAGSLLDGPLGAGSPS